MKSPLLARMFLGALLVLGATCSWTLGEKRPQAKIPAPNRCGADRLPCGGTASTLCCDAMTQVCCSGVMESYCAQSCR